MSPSEEESERRFRQQPWMAIAAAMAVVGGVGAGLFWAGRIDARLATIEMRGSPTVTQLHEEIKSLENEVQRSEALLEQHMRAMKP